MWIERSSQTTFVKCAKRCKNICCSSVCSTANNVWGRQPFCSCQPTPLFLYPVVDFVLHRLVSTTRCWTQAPTIPLTPDSQLPCETQLVKPPFSNLHAQDVGSIPTGGSAEISFLTAQLLSFFEGVIQLTDRVTKQNFSVYQAQERLEPFKKPESLHLHCDPLFITHLVFFNCNCESTVTPIKVAACRGIAPWQWQELWNLQNERKDR